MGILSSKDLSFGRLKALNKIFDPKRELNLDTLTKLYQYLDSGKESEIKFLRFLRVAAFQRGIFNFTDSKLVKLHPKLAPPPKTLPMKIPINVAHFLDERNYHNYHQTYTQMAHFQGI